MQPEIQIKDVNEDKLNRNSFAEKLANSIITYEFEETLTIGIMGSWGSGKSSLIKLTIDILKKEDFIVVPFNPWYFSNQGNLYLQFFKSIITTLNNNEIQYKGIFERKINPKRKLFKKSDNSVENYFNYLKDSSIELNLDNLYHPLNTADLESFDSLQFHKKQCEKYFNDLGRKIIVIIDDIYRLTDKEISQVFTLVKSLANFKNFIYILSFDKLIVTKALNKINSDENDKFIDKIIQIPISVPKISEAKMDELILEDIGGIYNEQIEKSFNDFSNNFGEIIDYLKIFIKDIRDLKRYKNTLKFYLTNFLEDLNMNDFFLILAIHLFEHELFLKIKENKDALVINKQIFGEDAKKQVTLPLFDKNMKEIIEKSDWNKYRDLLVSLFPALSQNNMPITYMMYKEWQNNHRICSESYFEKYFTLSLDANEISATSIHQLIKLNEFDKIFEFFTQSNDLSYNHSLLTKFRQLIPEIPFENIEIFIKALMKSGDSMEVYPFSRKYFPWIFNELSGRINSPEKCYKILEECIKFHEDNVFTLSEYIYSLAFDYGIAGNNKNPKTEDKMFINETQVKNLIKILLKKIHKSSENSDFLNQTFLQDMLTYWELLEDEHVVQNYVLENVNSNYEILSFLSKFQTIQRTTRPLTRGESKTELVFDFNKLNTYHGLEFYENEIKKILSTENLDDNTREFCELFLRQLEEYIL